LKVNDSSIYSDIAPIQCVKLEVTPPGFTTAYVIEDLLPGFIKNISACELGLQTSNCGNYYNDLADGVYVIRYSVSPNDVVFVEYNHLRTTSALNKINDLLCCLDIKSGEQSPSMKETLREVQTLMTLLKAAKAKVEYCHNPGQGMAIYNYVVKRLDKLSCGCGCSSCN
jgi:hypothetical protein